MRKYLYLLIFLLPLKAHSQDPIDIENVSQWLSQNTVTLPMDGLVATEQNGQIFYLSSNRRYLFQGQVIDLWQQQPLSSMQQIAYSATHIDMQKLNLTPDRLNGFSIGTGAQEVVVFVDPNCPFCKKFVKEAQQKPTLYTYHIILVPALGEDSVAQTRKFNCATKAAKKDAANYYVKGTINKMPQQKGKCDSLITDMTALAAHQFGITQIPFFIAPNKTFKAGIDNIWVWLAQQSH